MKKGQKRRDFNKDSHEIKEKSNNHKFIDIEGQRFGKLIVIGYLGSENKKTYWLCKCDCGKNKKIAANCLGLNTNSCGCLHKEIARETSKRPIKRSDGRYLTAFGETKTIKEWSKDSRCNVSYSGLIARLDILNFGNEEAITHLRHAIRKSNGDS